MVAKDWLYVVWVLTPLSVVWTWTPVLPVLLVPTGLTWIWSLLVVPLLPMKRSVKAGFDGSGSTATVCKVCVRVVLLLPMKLPSMLV